MEILTQEQYEYRTKLVVFLRKEVGPYSANLAERKIIARNSYIDKILTQLLEDLNKL